MNNKRAISFLWIAAWCVMAAALLLSVANWRHWPKQRKVLQRRLRDLNTLEHMPAPDDALQRMEALFDPFPARETVSLEAMAVEKVPSGRADIRRKEQRAIRDGWKVTRYDVIFNDAVLREVSDFITAAETVRPPWRIVECHITAATGAPGKGRVTMVLEGLRQTGDRP